MKAQRTDPPRLAYIRKEPSRAVPRSEYRETCSRHRFRQPAVLTEASIDLSVMGGVGPPHLPAIIGVVTRLQADESTDPNTLSL